MSVYALNNAGAVVGATNDTDGLPHAVQWVGANVIPVLPNERSLTAGYSWATAINTQGVVIGDSNTYGAAVFEIETNGVIEVGLYDHDVIVGEEDDWLPDYSDTYPIAVRWTPDPKTGAPGATVQALIGLGGRDSSASAINANGYIAGWATLSNKLTHAVIWGPTTRAVDLGTLGGKQSSAGGINAEGDIAGQAQDVNGRWRATLWTHKHYKPTDLNLEIDPMLAKQFTLTGASATNDRCPEQSRPVDYNQPVVDLVALHSIEPCLPTQWRPRLRERVQ